MGANIESITLENINFNIDKEKYPMGFLACVGPKSIVSNGYEIFDPYISCTVEELLLKNIKINGAYAKDISEYLREIDFSGFGGKGEFKKISVI